MALIPIIKLTLLLGCCISIVQLAWADSMLLPKSLIVVTSNKRPVSNMEVVVNSEEGLQPDIQILNLDLVTNIQRRLSDGLPFDPEKARAIVDQRIVKIGRSQLDAELREAYLPLGTMMAYGLDRFPVIIFDRRVVIYGITDLEKATKQYRQWVKDQQGGADNE